MAEAVPMCLKKGANLLLIDGWERYLRVYLGRPLKWWRRRVLEGQEEKLCLHKLEEHKQGL